MRTPIFVLLALLLPAPALATGGEGTINYIHRHNGECDLRRLGDPSREGNYCLSYSPPEPLYAPRPERGEYH